MPFINSFAESVLNIAFGKAASLDGKREVHLALGKVPMQVNKDGKYEYVFDTTQPALGFVELASTTGEVDNGYSRVMVARMTAKTSGSTTTWTPDSYPPFIASAAQDRGIQNAYQINWTKAVMSWERVNAFAISTSGVVGETGNIYFVGGLDLSEADKANGGLLVEKGAVALFDPAAFRIEFPAKDVEPDESAV